MEASHNNKHIELDRLAKRNFGDFFLVTVNLQECKLTLKELLEGDLNGNNRQ